ncbi:hypothetical protein 10S6_8 [uncultured Caudovirales phage]|uniref:Uncharacterized protein n=1 Tax=uncultured Caudovirales phage TaxID=2100421 RepID=A0A2H4JF97_9CAUD|nr:hypothetical protein 10S6_8 [uncultured Caudovirales phage]
MAWFSQTVRRLFGQSPVHEAAGRGRRALAWMPGNPGAVAAMLATHTDLRVTSRDNEPHHMTARSPTTAP